MRNYLKVLMVVGLLTLMMPLLLGYLAGPIGAAHPNTIGDHQYSKNITNETCDDCHDQFSKLPNDPVDRNAHRVHAVSAALEFYTNNPSVDKGCGKCHEESVYGGNVYYGAGIVPGYEGLGSGLEGDLSYTDTDTPNTGSFVRAARKQVKPDVCESCHGQFNGATPSHALVPVNSGNCIVSGSCHVSAPTGGDPVVQHAAANYIDQAFANSTTYCGLCHGALAWYQTTETTATLP